MQNCQQKTKKIVDENWEGLGAWIHLGLQRRKQICCFCLVCLFVCLLFCFFGRRRGEGRGRGREGHSKLHRCEEKNSSRFFLFLLKFFFCSLEYYLAVTTKLHWHRDLELRTRHGRKRSERVYEFERPERWVCLLLLLFVVLSHFDDVQILCCFVSFLNESCDLAFCFVLFLFNCLFCLQQSVRRYILIVWKRNCCFFMTFSLSLSLMLLLFEIRTCKQTRNGVPRVVVAKTRRTMKMLRSSGW